jgi:hypothetical protein
MFTSAAGWSLQEVPHSMSIGLYGSLHFPCADRNQKAVLSSSSLAERQVRVADTHHVIAEQQGSAKLLGFDKKSWDEERHVWSDDVYWRQLTLAQQAAAENIGYTQEVRVC